MNKFYKISFLFILSLLSSCRLYMGDKNLGNGYIWTADGDQSSIIVSTTKRYHGAGLEVVPPKVVRVEVDNKYIMVKSIDDSLVVCFWIIDNGYPLNLKDCKDQESCDSLINSVVKGPMDSLEFYGFINNNNLVLKNLK